MSRAPEVRPCDLDWFNARDSGREVLGLARQAALITVLSLAACETPAPFEEEYERFRAIQPGMTEQEVRVHLGTPTREFERETAPADYYVEGWSFNERPITNKVLIYVGSEPICYVYLDDANTVEEIFVGGS